MMFSVFIVFGSGSAYATQSNPNLFVSAENSQFNNYFAGPQVVQVVISDPDIQKLDQLYGEPIVTINGKKIRMAQATDGNWYAYFADRNSAELADVTQYISSSIPSTGKGLDFGEFCSSTSAINATNISFVETKGIAIAQSAPGASNADIPNNLNLFSTCLGPVDGSVKNLSGGSMLDHVVRHPSSLNLMSGVYGGKVGQIGINQNAWPVVQLYDFGATPTTVVIDYQKNGGDQISILTFDKIPYTLVSLSTNQQVSPSAPVLINIKDFQLNIDPTDKDSWTWGTSQNHNVLYYQAFDQNGKPDADGTIGMQDLSGNSTLMMFYHNGKLTVNPASTGGVAINLQSNGIQTLNSDGGTSSIPASYQPVTFIENSTDNGNFVNYDSAHNSDIVAINNLSQNTNYSATFGYNGVLTDVKVQPLTPIPDQNEENNTKSDDAQQSQDQTKSENDNSDDTQQSRHQTKSENDNSDDNTQSSVISSTTQSVTPSTTVTSVPTLSSMPSTIPVWVRGIFSYYGQGQISDSELINAINFLVQQGVIKLK